MLTFTPAGQADAEALLDRGARQADWRECFKTTGGSLGPALRFAVAASDLAVAARLTGRIIILFGVAKDRLAPPASNSALVWLAAHDEAERPDLAVSLARASRRFADCWQRQFNILHNVADPDNTLALRWLEWLGFVIDRENPVRGPLGHELYRFRRCREASSSKIQP